MCQKQRDDWWKGKKFSWFQNIECEFFPCHKEIESTTLNCLFCYCPLYVLGKHCGGNYSYLKNGIKDCSQCLLPHQPDNYGYIVGKFQEISDMINE